PRILNDPVRCRFSAFSRTRRSARRESVSEPKTGVMRAYSAIRSRAASTSARVGAVLVAKVENLLEYLIHGRERVELAALHLVEQPPQLRIPADGALQVPLRPQARNREHLVREVAAAPLLEPPVLREPRAV